MISNLTVIIAGYVIVRLLDTLHRHKDSPREDKLSGMIAFGAVVAIIVTVVATIGTLTTGADTARLLSE